MPYDLTLSEAESCLRKAARASGLDWGIAEEAGKSARWLAAFRLPGPETVFYHLRELAGRDYRGFSPNCDLQPWQASAGMLCPIVAGAALADRSATLLGGEPIRLGATAYPLLLVPALGQAANYHQTVFTLCWDGVRINCFADGITLSGNQEKLLAPEVSQVCCCREDLSGPEQHPSSQAYPIDEGVFREIDELAFQTYVPASDLSRAGAGAGLTDND